MSLVRAGTITSTVSSGGGGCRRRLQPGEVVVDSCVNISVRCSRCQHFAQTDRAV